MKTCDIIPEVYQESFSFQPQQQAVIIMLALTASSLPFTISAAIGFTGASSIHLRERFVSALVKQLQEHLRHHHSSVDPVYWLEHEL